MDKLLYLLGPLGCAAMMGAMMMWMMRGRHAGQGNAQPDPRTREEIAALRDEVAALRAQQAHPADSAQPTTRG